MMDKLFYFYALFVASGTFGVFVAMWINRPGIIIENNNIILVLETILSAGFLVFAIERIVHKKRLPK
jgi:hypothetical protein